MMESNYKLFSDDKQLLIDEALYFGYPRVLSRKVPQNQPAQPDTRKDLPIWFERSGAGDSAPPSDSTPPSDPATNRSQNL